MLDDHDPVVMAPTVIAPAVITVVIAKLGAGAHVAMAAFPDHDGLGAGNRRCRDRNRAQCCNNVTNLHGVLLYEAGIQQRIRRNVPPEPEENYEQPFSNNSVRDGALSDCRLTLTVR